MINAYNITEQTLSENDVISFDGFNFGRNRYTDSDSNNFTITKSGVYEIEVSLNVAPTVAGQIQLDLIRNGAAISGGTILLPGATVGTFENGSTKVIIPAIAGSTFSVRNSTPTNDITLSARGASLIIKRVA